MLIFKCSAVCLFCFFIGSCFGQRAIDILRPNEQGISPLDQAILTGNYADVKKTLEYSRTHCVVQESYQNDISFGIVDLKFDGETVKICEFGDGQISRFKGMDALYGNGHVWRGLWKFLYALGLPLWFISGHPLPDECVEKDLDFYKAMAGGVFPSISSAIYAYKTSCRCFQLQGLDFLRDNNLIVVSRNGGYDNNAIGSFKNSAPRALFLGDAIGPYGNSKLLMSRLMKKTGLDAYRPRCKVCEKKYTQVLSQQIIEELRSDYFVIKPINSSKGRGVIFVDKKSLDATLKSILVNPKESFDEADDTYGFWMLDKNNEFLVEEYVPSKDVLVRGQLYDATMRVIFILMCDHGQIFLNFLGAYWKLPAKSNKIVGSLTELHKSHIGNVLFSSAKVDLVDYEKTTQILWDILPKVYVNMLQEREEYHKELQK